MWPHIGEYLPLCCPEKGKRESQVRTGEREAMLLSYRDKMAAEEKRGERAPSVKKSQI